MSEGKVLVANHDGVYVLRMEGDVRVTLCGAVDAFIDSMFADENLRSVLVDLSAADAIDSTTLGLLARMSIKTIERLGVRPTLISPRPDITRVLVTMGLDDVFDLIEDESELEVPAADSLDELGKGAFSEDSMRRKVIKAHKALMSLNTSNRNAFRELVDTLEAS